MPGQKKFGTFSGVFTPSILTILGVIMYMRLPWIVGQAGFWMTAGMILVAHIVSVTTGLSVSSIATDKKVKAGGTYFIISRSLGLPIGGTLGIALFFGMSLSVSLYIIGFSESFLAFWQWPTDLNTIRITGTVALSLVGILTFISTSVAMRTQFFIMLAIGLSLVTILFGPATYVPAVPTLEAPGSMLPFLTLFAIFFPAVTGFEAGVSMSGDLRNAKKSIPVGTLTAIGTGLLVYLGLAAFFAWRVDPRELAENPNILLQISFFPPLLVAGIWGATLSSAIGSILGAPRILQATSQDRITPSVFSKTFGASQEPRIALLLTFLIAEGGILIGELDVIARIVSMFFITTYGFLNISCAIEQMTSTDFRPSFRIPSGVSIIGALICFILMLQLDFIALVGATVILAGIFLLLKRRELTLDSGDTWEGFWSSLLRSALERLGKTSRHQRHWRPNIILFQGRDSDRTYLYSLADWLVRKRGMLSIFNITDQDDERPVYKTVTKGFFEKNLYSPELYLTMRQVGTLYGFSGIEPNTVMLGWGGKTRDFTAYRETLKVLAEKNHNLLILDYDHEKGFGKMSSVDYLWSPGDKSLELGLSLMRFLQGSGAWSEAHFRLLVKGSNKEEGLLLKNRLTKHLADLRMEAEILLLSFPESSAPADITPADLTLLVLPNLEVENAEEYRSQCETILQPLGSCLMIHSSNFFTLPGFAKNQSSGGLSGVPASLPLTTVLEIPRIPKSIDYSEIDHALASTLENHGNLWIQGVFLELDQAFFQPWSTLMMAIRSEIYHQPNPLGNYQELRSLQGKINRIARLQAEDFKKYLMEEMEPGLMEVTLNFLKPMTNLAQEFPAKIKYLRNSRSRTFPLRKLVHLLSTQCIVEGIEPAMECFLEDLVPLARAFVDLYEILDKSKVTSGESPTFEEGILLLEKRLSLGKEKLKERIQGIMYLGFERSFHHFREYLDTGRQMHQLARQRKRIIKKSRGTKDQFPRDVTAIFQRSFFNYQFVLISSRFRIKVGKILDSTLQEARRRLEHQGEDLIHPVLELLEDAAKNPSLYRDPKKFRMPSYPYGESEEVFSSVLKAVESQWDNLPESLVIYPQELLEPDAVESPGEGRRIKPRYRFKFITEALLLEPLQQKFRELQKKSRMHFELLEEILKLIRFQLVSVESEDSLDEENFDSPLLEGAHRGVKILEETRNDLADFDTTVKKLLAKWVENLEIRGISLGDAEMEGSRQSKKKEKWYFQGKKFLKEFLGHWGVKVLFQSSQSLVASSRLLNDTSNNNPLAARIRRFLDRYEGREAISSQLPRYYVKLFSGDQSKNMDFLLPRSWEKAKAEELHRLFIQGLGGCIVVTGPRRSGKSTVSRMAGNILGNPSHLWEVIPPSSGIRDLGQIKSALEKAAGIPGTPEELLSGLRKNSCVIFHDLDMWWDQSGDGLACVDYIMDLVRKYSPSVLMVVNLNLDAYDHLLKMDIFKGAVLGVIPCQAFTAAELRDAILLRQRSSSLGLHFQGHLRFENLNSAHYFHRLFNLSHGIIGIAFDLWIASVSHSTPQSVSVRILPRPPGRFEWNQLQIPKEWCGILQTFLLHKSVSFETLVRTLEIPSVQAERLLGELFQAGLIQKLNTDEYTLRNYGATLMVRKNVKGDFE